MMSTSSLRVRPGRVSDALALRDIRLEALADTPDAFGETYQQCAAWGEELWTLKAQEWNFYLLERDGRVAGMARGESHNERPDAPFLFAMYVSPAERGTEAARLLVDTVSAWAAAEGVEALYLYVSTAVPRARAFYIKVGFTDTGADLAMHRDESLVCAEMRRDVSDFAFHVHRVEPMALYDLRRRVLRDDRPEVDVANPSDLLESTLHYGGFLGERTVVSASFFTTPSPTPPHAASYQLRYMATDYDVQGRGLGRRLLEQVIGDLSRRGSRELWANARTSAVDFYTSTGWRIIEDSLHVSAETGIEHVVIHRYVDRSATPD
jgi:GNAT superfamily N-acetyltransferase